MSVQQRGYSGQILEINANTRAARNSIYPLDIGSNGAFRVLALTGLITGIAAASATAGHIFAARWGHASKLCMITRLKARWVTIAGFTAAQEVGLDAIVARSFTSNHTGGTGLTLTTNNAKKRTLHNTSNFTDVRVATTGALTNVATTLDTQPIAWGGFSELAAAATVPKGFFTLEFKPDGVFDFPIVLAQNEGLLIRNTIAMGAGGTARVGIEMDWLELDSWY